MTLTRVPDAASTGYFTDALQSSGALGAGHVVGIDVLASFAKMRSHTFRLRLAYEGSSASAPTSVILKMGHPRRDDSLPYLNRTELAFYRNVAPTLSGRLVPRCFKVTDAKDAVPWQLLLEDLTETHSIASEHPLPPSYVTCQRIVRRWGLLHAALWNAPQLSLLLETSIGETWSTYLRQSQSRYQLFVDRFAELVPGERRQIYERLFCDSPRLIAQFQAGRPLTIVHGDAHWWNCFVPRESIREEVRLIDWESWTVGVAAMDLSYMMAMLWFPELRRAAEQPLLDCYHDALLGGGVTDYSRAMLSDDYRWSVLFQMLRPIWQATSGIPARVWWPNLERNSLAFEDLGCRDLLG